MWVGDSFRRAADGSPGGKTREGESDETAVGGDLVDFELARPRKTLAMPPVRDVSVAGLSSPGRRDM